MREAPAEDESMRRLKALIIFAIIAVIAFISISWTYGWFLGQTIYRSMYSSKSGVDYWATWTLQNNLFSASALLTILSMITLPQRSTLMTFLSTLSQFGRTTHRLPLPRAVVWRLVEAVGLFGFYVSSGGYSVTGQNVAFLMMLIGHGSISVSPQDIGTLFALPFAPGTSADSVVSLVPAMEAYQLYVGLIATFLAATAVRVALSIATDLMAQRRDVLVIFAKALVIGALALCIEILGVPTWTVNAGTWLTYLAYIVALASCIMGSFLFMAFRLRSGDVLERARSKIAQLEEDLARMQGELLSLRQEYEGGSITVEEYRKKVNMLMEDRSNIAGELRRLKIERLVPISGSPRKFGLLAIVLIAIVLMLPVIQALYYGIQMSGDKYIDWKFNYETTKEITITNWAAGVQGMQTKTLQDLTLNATPQGEAEYLTTVRQWDQEASYLRMKNQIGTNWMQLADSDIVFLKNHEYWIAPLTLDYSTVSTSFINQHLIYTHTEGMVVQDAYTGNIVDHSDLIALLNRSKTIDTFYGEGEGFSGPVFVNVPGVQEVGNVTFQGQPDYKLSGFESSFFIFSMGPEAWSFAGQNLDMLLERDVHSRVNKILLQGLTADQDAYIVVEPSGGLDYAVSVFIDYRLSTGYAHEDYMRFIGVILVNIETGTLAFYRSHSANSTFFIDKTYDEYYPWQDMPTWLQSQVRWPEDLYERQLDVLNIYHVTDGFVWRSGVDFFEPSSQSDTRYMVMRIAGVDRFVAAYNVEFLQSPGKNLAGLYVMGCGNKDFGNLTFYGSGSVGVSTYLGPEAARQAFETNDKVRTQLSLWGQHRYGNILIYHLGGLLFYVIPVFLEVETTTTTVIEKLGGVGLVDAETGARVTLGSNVVEAFYLMFGLSNRTVVQSGQVGFESASFSPTSVVSGLSTSLITLMKNNDNVTHSLDLDIVVFAGNFTVNWHGANVLPTVYPQNSTFTLHIGNVGPGDSYGTSPTVTAYLPTGIVFATYLVIIVLRTEEGLTDQLSLFLTIT
jgi:hypothetical protein